MSGLFITVEGTDGSGKSTQIALLKKYLENKGLSVIFVREPGSTKISEKIRNIILDIENKEMDYKTEALLYSASRAQLVNQVIKPALKNGDIVLCDRFVDSSIVYQGIARNIGAKEIENINKFATDNIIPDITLLLKLNPEIAMQRKKEQQSFDRIEAQEQYFYNKVYGGYLMLARKYPKRIKVINASNDIEIIHNNMIKEVRKLINKGF